MRRPWPVKRVCACGCQVDYFKSVKEASRFVGSPINSIQHRLNESKVYDRDGYKWYWLTEEEAERHGLKVPTKESIRRILTGRDKP